MTQELIVAPATDDAPVPAYSGEQMTTALSRYRELQHVFDREMPDAIMTIGNKQFRKRAYWRAVSVAFKLTLEPIEERREVHGGFGDGAENFGYLVTYRATSPNGRAASGDGSCFAVEKAGKFKCPHTGPQRHYPTTTCPSFDPAFAWRVLPAEATEHNVRAHAHTRAYNRAVSNLVGFGEVSAEEATLSESEPPLALAPPAPRDRVPGEDDGPPLFDEVPPVGEPARTTDHITENQAKRFYAIARGAGWSEEAMKKQLLHAYGIEGTRVIPRSHYERIVLAFQQGPNPR